MIEVTDSFILSVPTCKSVDAFYIPQKDDRHCDPVFACERDGGICASGSGAGFVCIFGSAPAAIRAARSESLLLPTGSSRAVSGDRAAADAGLHAVQRASLLHEASAGCSSKFANRIWNRAAGGSKKRNVRQPAAAQALGSNSSRDSSSNAEFQMSSFSQVLRI